jgi:hypothetical protein
MTDITSAPFKARHTLAAALRALAYLYFAHRQTMLRVVFKFQEDLQFASRLSDFDAHGL